MWAGRGGDPISICSDLFVLGRGGNILGAHEALLDAQRPIVTDGQNDTGDGAVLVCVRLPFALQGLDLAEPRLDGVVFFRFGIGPILTVILRRQFFLSRNQTFLFGKQVRIGEDYPQPGRTALWAIAPPSKETIVLVGQRPTMA